MSTYHSGRLSIIPSCAFDDKLMTPTLIRVLGALASYGNARGYCWPGQEAIAKRIGVTRNAVNMSLKKLEELGYIKSWRRKRKKDQGESSKEYRLILDILLPRERYRVSPEDEDPPVSSEFTGGVSSEFTGGVNSELTQNVSDSERRESNDSFATPAAPRECVDHKIIKDDIRPIPDPLWIAFAQEIPVPPTKSGRGAWSRALRELREVGADAASIHTACAAYRDRWPTMLLTPTAVAKFWHVFNGASHDLTTSGPSQHQQSLNSPSADRAGNETRQRAQHAWHAFVWSLEPFELDQPESALRERFASQYPELAPWLPRVEAPAG